MLFFYYVSYQTLEDFLSVFGIIFSSFVVLHLAYYVIVTYRWKIAIFLLRAFFVLKTILFVKFLPNLIFTEGVIIIILIWEPVISQIFFVAYHRQLYVLICIF